MYYNVYTSLTEDVSAIQGGVEEKCLKISKEKRRHAHASLSKGLHFVKSYLPSKMFINLNQA